MSEELSVLESEVSCDTCAYIVPDYLDDSKPSFNEPFCKKGHKIMDANLCGDYLHKDKLYGNR